MRVCLLLALALAGAAQAGDPANASEALHWLKRMAAASRQLNYAGTIVYQPAFEGAAHTVRDVVSGIARLEPRLADMASATRLLVLYVPNR